MSTPIRRSAIASFGTIVVVFSLAACNDAKEQSNDRSATFNSPPAASKPVDSVTWATRSEPTSLDSSTAFGGDTQVILSNVCEGLMKLRTDGSFRPLLAEKVESPDDTTYVITLRDDVRFFDGKPMTATDAVFSLKRTLDPKTGSFFGRYGGKVTSVAATGPHTMTIKLSQPDPVFFEMLATPLGHVMERSYVTEAGSKYGSASYPPMCTGPYEVDTWKRGESIQLAANDNWWKGERQLARAAKFVFLADDAALTAALTTGDVDGSFVAPASSLSTLRKSQNVNAYVGPSTFLHTLIVAHEGGVLADGKLRQALQKTIDYKGAADALFNGAAEPLKAVAPPGSWGDEKDVYKKAYDALPAANQDLSEAKRLVAQSGVSDPKVTLGVPSWLPELKTFGESFQNTAKRAGLTVDLKLLPQADFLSLFSDPKARGKLDLFYSDYVAWIPDPTEVYTAIGTPDGPANFGGYDNAQVAKILSKASRTVDPAKRASLVVEAQASIMRDLPWIPFIYQYQTLTLNKRLAGTPVEMPNWFYNAWLPETGSAG